VRQPRIGQPDEKEATCMVASCFAALFAVLYALVVDVYARTA
jgi:hypothetical protein